MPNVSFVFTEEELKLVTRPLSLDNNWFFELVEPDQISYTYKVRPAKDFGAIMVITFSIFHVKFVIAISGIEALIHAPD